MRQTLLALAALMTAAFLNYSQMKTSLQEQEQVVRSEIEQMALGVAMQTIEVVRARAFDENDPEGSLTNPEDALTAPSSFPQGLDCKAFGGDDECNDVDDFNEMQTAVVPFETPEFQFDFNVDITVRYVNDAMEACVGGEGEWPECTKVGPTLRKEVIIQVQDRREDPYLHEPIRFTEVITYY